MKTVVKKILKSAGLKISKITEKDGRYLSLLEKYGINKILDVGANKGQYAIECRNIGYKGTIISFEPVTDAYTILKSLAENDSNWQTVKTGLGNIDGEVEINVAANSYSSSILEMLPSHLQAAPESAYIAKEKINILKLDTVFSKYCSASEKVFLKLDTQGYEKEILAGGTNALSKICGVQLEMSLFPMYKDEMLFQEAVTMLDKLGFKLCGLENSFTDRKTGQLLQVDGVFYRIN